MFITFAIGIPTLFICLYLAVQTTTHRRSNDAISFSTIEEKTLLKITRLYDRFKNENEAVKRKQLYYYYKQCKIVLVVYMKERFDITVRDRITYDMQQNMHHISDYEKLFFKDIFERLRKIKSDSLTHSNIEQFCRDLISYYKTKC